MAKSDIYCVTVAIDYKGSTTSNQLTGMGYDVDTMSEMFEESGISTKRIKKLKNTEATLTNISNAIKEGVKHDFFIFHFSGHGGQYAGREYMRCADGGRLFDTTFWNMINQSKGKVMCIFANCYAGGMFRASQLKMSKSNYGEEREQYSFFNPKKYFKGNNDNQHKVGFGASTNSTSDFNFKSLLVWAACTENQESIMFPYQSKDTYGNTYREGHQLVRILKASYDKDKSYNYLWDILQFQTRTNSHTQNPQQTIMGEDFTKYKIFTEKDETDIQHPTHGKVYKDIEAIGVAAYAYRKGKKLLLFKTTDGGGDNKTVRTNMSGTKYFQQKLEEYSKDMFVCYIVASSSGKFLYGQSESGTDSGQQWQNTIDDNILSKITTETSPKIPYVFAYDGVKDVKSKKIRYWIASGEYMYSNKTSNNSGIIRGNPKGVSVSKIDPSNSKCKVDNIIYSDKYMKEHKDCTYPGGSSPSKKNRVDVFFSRVRHAINNDTKVETGVKYNVTFQDYDGKVISTVQVEEGKNATPPSNPTRDGYDFSSWSPSYQNITKDTVCIAQYTQKTSGGGGGSEDVGINNLSSQLIELKLHDNVLSVGDNSFCDCVNLEKVTCGPYTSFIGTNAFRNCTSLTSFSRLSDKDSSHVFDIVGNSAFRNTGLKSLKLSLRSSSIYTFWGDYCFADNKNLTNVHILSSCYLSKCMFSNCSNLTGVYFDNDQTSYVYPYVFRNCTSLQKITLPSKIWYVSENMFKGCKKLKSIKWKNYLSASTQLVQKYAFNGCESLTEIEFPASLNSLSCFEDGCFSNCPKLTTIKFDGLNKSQIQTKESVKVEQKIEIGKVYVKEGEERVKEIITYAYKAGIPIVYFQGGINCSICNNQFLPSVNTTESQKKAKKTGAIFIYEVFNQNFGRDLIQKKYGSDIPSEPGASFVEMKVYYYDKTKKEKKVSETTAGHSSIDFDNINKYLTEWGYDKSKVEDLTYGTYVPTIYETGFFRLNHDATIIDEDGKKIKYKYDKTKQKSETKDDEYTSDKTTTKDFKPGKSYYNVKNVMEQAQLCCVPCLTIYSLLGCEPCQMYSNNIFSNDYFQSWLSSQNFYFCGMEVEKQPYYDKQLQYAVNELAHNALNYQKYDSTVEPKKNVYGDSYKQMKTSLGINDNIYTPVLVFYYRYKKPGTEDEYQISSYYLHTYHDIYKQLDTMGVKGTIDLLKSLCLYYFDGNDVKKQHWCQKVKKAYDPKTISTWRDYKAETQYYDEKTGIINLTTRGTLEDEKKRYDNNFNPGDAYSSGYMGGCQLENFTYFEEIGITDETSPLDINSKLSGKIFQFTDGQYTMTIDVNDTAFVYSPCSSGNQAVGYKMIWTKIS